MKKKSDQDLRAELMNKLREELDSYKALVEQYKKATFKHKQFIEQKNNER